MVCSCSWLIFAKFKLSSYRRWGPTLDIFFCLRVPGPLKTVMNSVQKQKCPSYQRETDCIFLRFLGSNHSWSSLAISGFRWVCLLLRNITLIYDPGFNRESWFWKDTIQQQKTQSNTEWPKQWHWLVSSFFRMIRDWLITTGCNSNVVQYCGELRVASGFQWATIAGYWVYWILKGSDSAIMYISIPDLDFAGNQASESPIVFPGIRRQTKPGMGAGEAPIACRVAQQFCKNHGMKNLVPTMRIPQLIYSKCNHIW